MTTYLYSILTAGADKMAQMDPHGWTLTVVSVSVVFAALFILFLVYGLSGELFIAAAKKTGTSLREEKTDTDAEIQAAIALALHLYQDEEVHDIESGIITIDRPGNWANLNIRRK